MSIVHPIFLTDGGQPPAVTAHALAAFCAKARERLHVAIYNVMLAEGVAAPVVRVLREKAAAGVEVRIAFDDTAKAVPTQTKPWLVRHFAKSHVVLRAIHGASLMHDKYVVRDPGTPRGAVWTGSANFTDDAWAWQENNVLVVELPELARMYEQDFAELWTRRGIARTGGDASGEVRRGSSVFEVDFSPGGGARIEQRIVSLIAGARRRVLVASMDLASSAILRALCTVQRRAGVALHGIVDGGSMRGLEAWWRTHSDPNLARWRSLQRSFVEKPSSPFDRDNPNQRHNFMHDKIVVVDDTVATGSFNLSRHAKANAENELFVRDTGLARRFGDYVQQVVAKYRH
jgi:phosphatidylserine/phosphatidylglycerophosphate/cardiolipin synthase-like enzyme